jgi:hypothetical protein
MDAPLCFFLPRRPLQEAWRKGEISHGEWGCVTVWDDELDADTLEKRKEIQVRGSGECGLASPTPAVPRVSEASAPAHVLVPKSGKSGRTGRTHFYFHHLPEPARHHSRGNPTPPRAPISGYALSKLLN